MATDERKVQLGVSVDATEARQGFNEVKASAKDMAQAVAAEGDKAGKAIGGVGDGGQAASRKIERETANIIQSVQRATAAMEAGKKSGSEYYEALAKQRGVDVNVLKPYLDQLAAVEAKQKQAAAAMSGGAASMDKLGVSAAQTAAAMRGVPAQFTDIITSLQGGQKPLTVLLQQGGQLKDMFGGIGPAARALGGYVAGLINPFTLAAAAAGGLFLAYRAGAAEGEEFRKTLILTGNALGLTADKMTAMSARIGAVVGTQHQAAEAINVMAQSARVGAAELESMTATAVSWQQATGTAVSETAKAFAELAKSPVEASLKLNESVNYLTDSVYRQIKALQGAGKEAEAAALAQKAYADALNDRAPKMVQNLGAIETAWKNIKSAIAGAWSSALEIGRDKSMVDQIKSQTAAVEALEQKLNDRQARGVASGKLQAQLDAAKGLLKNLQDQATATDAVAKADKDRADQLERGKRITDYTGDNGRKTRAQQMRDELAKEKGLYEERKKDAAGNAKDLLAIENAYQTAASTIRDKYKDKKSAGGGGISATDTEVASLRGRIEAEKQLAAQLAATAGTTSKLNEGEKLSLQYAEKLKLATNAKTKARLEDLKAMADTLGVQQRANADELEYAKQREKYFDDQNKVVASIEAKAVALEDEIATYGMGKAAIEATAIARLEEQKAVLAGFTGSEENIRLIDQEIDARKRLMSATSQKESLDANKKAAEQAAADWKRGSEEINRSLTDALLRGFESGKGFAENLRDTIKNMFNTLVLRPIISAVMQPVAGGIQSMLGMGGQSGVGGVGGAINLLSGARNVYAALQGGVSLPGFMATPLAEMAGGDILGNLIALKGAGTGGATPGIAGVSGAMNAAAGIGGGYMLGSAISGQYNAIGGTQAWASGGGAAMGAAIGSIVPGIGTIIGGLIGGSLGGVVNRAFGMGPKEYGHRGFEGTVTSGGFDGQNFADWKQKGGWFRSNRSGTEYSAIDQPVLDKLNSGFDVMVGTLKGLRSAAGEPAFNESLNDFRYGMRNDWSVPENFNKSMTDLSDALSRHLFPGLDGLKREGESLLDTAVRLTGVFKATSNTAEILGKDISTAFGGSGMEGAGARQHMVDFAGGTEQLTAITSAYMDTAYSDSEKVAYAQKQLTEQFNALGFSLPKTTAELRGWIEQQDLATAGEAEHAVALMALTPAFAQLEQAMQSLGQTAVEVRSGIAELEDILLTDEQKYQNRLKVMQQELNDLGIGSLKTRDQLLDFARSLDRNTEAGEAAYQSLVRVAPTFLEVAAAAEAAAAKTKELTDNYFSLFKSPTEQLARTREQLAEEFGKLGQALPTSASAYTQLVDSIDTSTEANRKLKEQLMALAWPMNGFLQQLEQLGQQTGTGLQDILRQQMVLLEAQRNKVNSLIAEAQAALQLRGNARSLLSQIGGALGQAGNTAGRKDELWGMLGSGITAQQQLDIAGELMGLITQTAAVDTSAAQELMSSAQASASAANSLLSAAKVLEDQGRKMRDWVASLRTGQLSPLTMQEKLEEAGRQYEATLKAAQGGDQNAIGNLQGSASAYLELARTFYASSDQYTAIFNSVAGAVDALGAGLMGQGGSQAAAAQAQLDAANQQIGIAQDQLDAAKQQTGLSQAQIDELTRLQTFVQGIESAADANYQDLTGKLGTELGVLQAMEKALGQEGTVAKLLGGLPAGLAAALQPLINTMSGGTKYANDLYQQYLGRQGDTTGVNYWAQQFAEGTRTVDDFVWGVYEEQVKKAYKDILGREADEAGLRFYVKQMQDGRAITEIRKDLEYGKLTGAYAGGGLAPRGLALVGEEGPEIVDFESPGRVYSSGELSRALTRVQPPDLSGYRGSDEESAALREEVRRLTQRVVELTAVVERVGAQDVATQVAVAGNVAAAVKEGTKEAAQVAQTRKAPIV